MTNKGLTISDVKRILQKYPDADVVLVPDENDPHKKFYRWIIRGVELCRYPLDAHVIDTMINRGMLRPYAALVSEDQYAKMSMSDHEIQVQTALGSLPDMRYESSSGWRLALGDYFVYVYYDPETMQPFYIGKGKRYRWNLKAHRHETQPYLVNKIRKIGVKRVIVKYIGGFTNAEACEWEHRLIIKYGRKDQEKGSLLNLTDGGDGNGGWSQRPETIQKRQETYQRNAAAGKHNYAKPWAGKTRSKEDRQKIADTLKVSMKGKNTGPKSEDHKRKLREAAKNRPPVTDETRRRLSEATKCSWKKRRRKGCE